MFKRKVANRSQVYFLSWKVQYTFGCVCRLGACVPTALCLLSGKTTSGRFVTSEMEGIRVEMVPHEEEKVLC